MYKAFKIIYGWEIVFAKDSLGGCGGHRFVTAHPQHPLDPGQTQHLHFLKVGKVNLKE